MRIAVQSKEKILEAGADEVPARKNAELCGALCALSAASLEELKAGV